MTLHKNFDIVKGHFQKQIIGVKIMKKARRQRQIIERVASLFLALVLVLSCVIPTYVAAAGSGSVTPTITPTAGLTVTPKAG